MINKGSIRKSNTENYTKCLDLRKKGYSYAEIMAEVPVAKSTLNNWLSFSGLTKDPEHFNIQKIKRAANWERGVIVSQEIREQRNKDTVLKSILALKRFVSEPLFIAGIVVFESEGSKYGSVKVSNSDYRLILLFSKFISTYFPESVLKHRLYLHESRKGQLLEILGYWSQKLDIQTSDLRVSWKRSSSKRSTYKKSNHGQIMTTVSKSKLLSRKLRALSDIIIEEHLGLS